MNSYLKWAFPSGAALLILGVIIGIKAAGKSSDSSQLPKPTVTASVASFPAPAVTIISHPILAVDRPALRHSSSLYGESSDRWTKRKSKWHKKVPAAKEDATGDPAADLGVMAADDPKLLKAESEIPKVVPQKAPERTPSSGGISPRDPAGA
jgi:hypothetical protein